MQSDKCNNNHNCPPLRFHADDGSEYSDWSKDTLGNLGTFDKGKTLSKADISDSGTPMVLYGELYTHYDEIARNIVRKTKHPLDDIYITKGREVVLPCSGETAEDISTATCIISKGVALGSDLIIYNSNFVAGEIISYILNHQQKWNIAKLAQGKSVVHISADLLKKLEIVYPASSDEQQKIIALFSAYDEKIAFQKERVKILLEQKKGLLQKMFPQKGETVPELRIPGFTGDWEQRKLGELVNVCSGRDYKHLSEGNIPVYGTGGYMLSVNEALSYDEDAIGIGRKGTIDKPFILNAPFWTVDTLFYAIPRERVDLNFAFDIFQNIDWKKKDESTGVPSLSKTAINDIDVLAPKPDEQQTIGRYFANIDHLITLHQRKLELLKEIKKGLLQQMFC